MGFSTGAGFCTEVAGCGRDFSTGFAGVSLGAGAVLTGALSVKVELAWSSFFLASVGAVAGTGLTSGESVKISGNGIGSAGALTCADSELGGGASTGAGDGD